MRKKIKQPPGGLVQLALDFVESETETPSRVLEIKVPVETAFDVSQGLREIITFWSANHAGMDVIFDCRHLELAEAYVYGSIGSHSTSEDYLIGKGGLINTSVFVNLYRCCQSLETWSKEIQKETGITPIHSIKFLPPRSSTKVGKLWQDLGVNTHYDSSVTPKVGELQSRYITPILWVSKQNESEVIQKFMNWVVYISDRLSSTLQTDLIRITTEVIANLIKFGFSQGFYGVSVWPSGQVEIVWSNSIAHLKDWPPEDTASGIITGLRNSSNGGGAGMRYILDYVLPLYNGLLAVNCKGNDVIFHSCGTYSFFCQSSPNRQDFLPSSVLFTLHLFCPQTRQKSEESNQWLNP